MKYSLNDIKKANQMTKDLIKSVPKKNKTKLGGDMLKLLMEAQKDDYNFKEFFS